MRLQTPSRVQPNERILYQDVIQERQHEHTNYLPFNNWGCLNVYVTDSLLSFKNASIIKVANVYSLPFREKQMWCVAC